MYKKILVPLDGSELAECVIPHVESLSQKDTSVHVICLYVITVDIPMAGLKYKSKIEEEARGAAEEYLKNLSNKVKFRNQMHSDVVVGKAAETIVDYSTKNQIDLIVMATHGRSGLSRWTHGSVADKVIHQSKIPVWLINSNTAKRQFPQNGQKIKMLVPLDGSKLAEDALKHLLRLSQQFGKDNVEIHLFRAVELFSPPFIYPPEMPINLEEYIEYERKRATNICIDYLKNIQEKLQKEGVNSVYAVQDGNPADVIIDYSNKNNIDLILMSTHGRTGLSRWAFGSIAEKVLQTANYPIFLIRSQQKEIQK